MHRQRNPRYVGVLLFDHSGNLILEERHQQLGFNISTFGGAVHERETDTAAAQREVLEETGVVLDQNHLTPLAALPKWNRRHLIHCQYYVYEVPLSIDDLTLLENIRVVVVAAEDITRPHLQLTPTARVSLELYLSSRLTRSEGLHSSPSDCDFTAQYATHRYLAFWEATRWTA